MLQHKFMDVCGTNIHYVEQGSQHTHKGTMVFLHGFPEYWETWSQQLEYFSQFQRVIAPDLPGYNLSGKPENDEFYLVPNLIKVMGTFLHQVNDGNPVTLVAHDWGGAIAWPLAAFSPGLVTRLVILNAAHPSTFTREMIENPVQRAKSDYIHQLVAEDAVDVLSADNCRYLADIVFPQFENDSEDDSERQAYLNAWQQPGAIQGMVRYYRSMPQLASREKGEDSGMSVSDMKVPQIRINVPTLVLWGVEDKAFVPEILDGIEQYVPDLRVKRFENATHWLQREEPDGVNESILSFIQA